MNLSGSAEARLAEMFLAGLAGDQRAYGQFLERTATMIRGFMRHRTANSAVDAEDIVQETLLAIHLKRHTWERTAQVMPWVFAIARHKLIDAYRRQGRRIEVDISEFADSLAQPESEAISDRELGRALELLPNGQRAVVGSISVEGKSISETAQQLSMSETAVRVALHRGLRAIAKRFGQT